MRPGVILFFVLFFSALFSAVKQFRDLKLERAERRMLKVVYLWLAAYATHGDWNPALTAELRRILKEYPTQ